jgi:hypothetical protein
MVLQVAKYRGEATRLEIEYAAAAKKAELLGAQKGEVEEELVHCRAKLLTNEDHTATLRAQLLESQDMKRKLENLWQGGTSRDQR